MNEKTRIVLADAAEDFRHMLDDMFTQEADIAGVGCRSETARICWSSGTATGHGF